MKFTKYTRLVTAERLAEAQVISKRISPEDYEFAKRVINNFIDDMAVVLIEHQFIHLQQLGMLYATPYKGMDKTHFIPYPTLIEKPEIPDKAMRIMQRCANWDEVCPMIEKEMAKLNASYEWIQAEAKAP